MFSKNSECKIYVCNEFLKKKISKKEIRFIIRVYDFRYLVNFNYGSYCFNWFDDFLW